MWYSEAVSMGVRKVSIAAREHPRLASGGSGGESRNVSGRRAGLAVVSARPDDEAGGGIRKDYRPRRAAIEMADGYVIQRDRVLGHAWLTRDRPPVHTRVVDGRIRHLRARHRAIEELQAVPSFVSRIHRAGSHDDRLLGRPVGKELARSGVTDEDGAVELELKCRAGFDRQDATVLDGDTVHRLNLVGAAGLGQRQTVWIVVRTDGATREIAGTGTAAGAAHPDSSPGRSASARRATRDPSCAGRRPTAANRATGGRLASAARCHHAASAVRGAAAPATDAAAAAHLATAGARASGAFGVAAGAAGKQEDGGGQQRQGRKMGTSERASEHRGFLSKRLRPAVRPRPVCGPTGDCCNTPGFTRGARDRNPPAPDS